MVADLAYLVAFLWAQGACAVWAALIRHGNGRTPGMGFGLGLFLGLLGVVICAIQDPADEAAARKCAACGTFQSAGNRFCEACGTGLLP